MIVLGLVLLLAASIASLPFWSYSQRWGFVPSTTAGVLLFFVALVAVGGKPAQSETTVSIAAAPAVAAPVVATPTSKPTGYVLDSSRQPIPLQRASASAATDAVTRNISEWPGPASQ